MKKVVFIAIVALASIGAKAQNVFPANGNVGIGTADPKYKLDVIGDISLGGDRSRGLNIVQFYMSLGETENGASTILGNNIKVADNENNMLKVHRNASDGSGWMRINYHHGFTFHRLAPSAVGTKVSEDGGELFRITPTGNVGIGTKDPGSKLNVIGNISIGGGWDRGFNITQSYMSLGETENGASTILGNNIKVADDENNMLKVHRSSSDGSGWMRINYHHGFTFHRFAPSAVGTKVSEDGGELFRITPAGNVGIGTTKPQSLLTVNGTITSKEVKVTLEGWSDFVFEPGYDLPTLEEVEEHIKEHKHLPDVPNEAEVKENGLSLGESNAVLLQKIEELTLYLIEQNKEIKSLKEEIKELKSEN